jgi:hypothetical protein
MNRNSSNGFLRVITVFAAIFLMEVSVDAQLTTPNSVVRPRVSMEFENELITLAKGYEEGFSRLPPGGKYIIVTNGSSEYYLDGGVDTVMALEGVLYIKMEKGIVHIISARDIVRITTEKPTE